MSKKPDFETNREKRLIQVQKELEEELFENDKNSLKKTIQTTLVVETELHHAIQEIGLRRRRRGIKPYTLTGIIKEALKEIIAKEGNE